MDRNYPQIPDPFSSKQNETRISELEGQKRKFDEKIVRLNKRVKKYHSFDTEIWTKLKEIDSNRINANGLQRKISMLSMNLNDEDKESAEQWAVTAEGKAILEQEAALKKSFKLMTQQSERIIHQPKSKRTQQLRTWTQLFIDSRLGMNVIKPSRKRSSDRQKQFRKELVVAMNASYPDTITTDILWCPVTGDWSTHVVAGHLFPAKSGDELMKTIFGEAEQDMWIGKPEQGKSELFRACNGILWEEQAERRFSKGLFTIVPDLGEDPTPAQTEAWQLADPKEYRIRVLDADHKDMRMLIKHGSDLRWADLDNKRLQWRSSFRPRARYLYYSYVEMMLRQTYHPNSDKDAAAIRRKEAGKKFWGSAGPYMKRNMLLGFVEEMGHEYEYLMEGAMDADDEGGDEDDDGDKPAEVAVMLANESILEKHAITEYKESRVFPQHEQDEEDALEDAQAEDEDSYEDEEA